MARKIIPPPRLYGSAAFRRNVPGVSLASVRQSAKYKGQLYAFSYRSRGSLYTAKNILRRARDPMPLLLLAYRKGQKVWRAGNGKTLIYGFNLNYINERRRMQVIREMIQAVSENKGGFFSYEEIKAQLNLPNEREVRIFRKYDVRGGKLRYLKEVDLNTYASYLENKLEFNQPK